jgi:hypothetical protein
VRPRAIVFPARRAVLEYEEEDVIDDNGSKRKVSAKHVETAALPAVDSWRRDRLERYHEIRCLVQSSFKNAAPGFGGTCVRRVGLSAPLEQQSFRTFAPQRAQSKGIGSLTTRCTTNQARSRIRPHRCSMPGQDCWTRNQGVLPRPDGAWDVCESLRYGIDAL